MEPSLLRARKARELRSAFYSLRWSSMLETLPLVEARKVHIRAHSGLQSRDQRERSYGYRFQRCLDLPGSTYAHGAVLFVGAVLLCLMATGCTPTHAKPVFKTFNP